MSALKPLSISSIENTSIWFILFDESSIDEKLNKILTCPQMNIWGLRHKEENYDFDDLIERLPCETRTLAYVIHGLFVSCSTGIVNNHLQTYLKSQWISKIFRIRINGEPVFPLICQRQMHILATWMVDWLSNCDEKAFVINDCLQNGDSALHMAIRNRHWDWATWLIASGCNKYSKNKADESPLLLMAPHEEHVHLLRGETLDWYNNLHDAFGVNSSWTQRLIDEGADINQPKLYGLPVDILFVLAKNGMDMNLNPLPPNLSDFHFRILYGYGRVPDDWKRVLHAFDDINFVKGLFQFFENDSDKLLMDEYKENLKDRRSIMPKTIAYAKRIQNEI